MRRLASGGPWGLLGMVALVVIVEASFQRYEARVLMAQHWDWRNAATQARTPAVRQAQVLCFGDSLVKLMLLPPTLESEAGLSSYNLAVPGGKPPVSHSVFRRALGAGARPKAVVLEAAPHLLADKTGVPGMLRLAPEAMGVADLFELGWTARDPELLARLVGTRVLRTLRARSEIRAFALATARREPQMSWWAGMVHLRHLQANRGAMVHAPDPKGPPVVNDLALSLYQEFTCDPVNAAYLDRFLALAESHGIASFLVVPPLSPQAQAYAERNGYDAAHTAFLRALQARHPGLTVIDTRHSGFDAAQFYSDPFHLNGDAAASASRGVAALIRDRLDGRTPAAERWVNLPAFDAGSARGLAVATGAEEFGETIEKLKLALTSGVKAVEARQAAARRGTLKR